MTVVIPLEYLSSGSLCSDRLVTFQACRLAVSITWVNCGRRLLAGLVVTFVPSIIFWARSMFPWWGVVTVVAGCSGFVFCALTWGGAGKAVPCMSNMRFTFDVLDLVFMVGARDGEMGGEGESSPTIVGIGRMGPVLWPVLWKGGAALCAWCAGGVAPYSSTRGSMSSSCCDSGVVLVWLWVFLGGGLTGSASFNAFRIFGGGDFGWGHGSGCGWVGRGVGCVSLVCLYC